MPDRPPQWIDLFPSPLPGSAQGMHRELLVFKKAGEPLLVVSPDAPKPSALNLYPAQTTLARLARFMWRQSLRLGFAPGAERIALDLDPAAPFLQFLGQLCGTANPPFALLAGNPHAPGRRFLLLLFEAGNPKAVVKAGIGPDAAALLAAESQFLANYQTKAQGIPKLLGTFQGGAVNAFAMEYAEGESPRPVEAPRISVLLNAWLRAGRKCALRELPAWVRLVRASGGDKEFNRLDNALANLSVQAPLFHGDLAPWNIKVSRTDGSWTVLDWERGEPAGPPAWDWFHFVLQPAILVRRQPALGLVETIHGLLSSAPFADYAQAAGINGFERALLLAYLFYCRDVLRPAEGSPRIPELLSLLAAEGPRI